MKLKIENHTKTWNCEQYKCKTIFMLTRSGICDSVFILRMQRKIYGRLPFREPFGYLHIKMINIENIVYEMGFQFGKRRALIVVSEEKNKII